MKKYIKCGKANERDKRVEYIIDTLNYLTRYGSGVSQDEKQADKLVEKMYNIASDIESLLHSAKSSTSLGGRNITVSEDDEESPSFVELPKNISAIIESTMPSNNGIVYSYDVDEDVIQLYANASEDDYGYDPDDFPGYDLDEDEDLDSVAIYSIEDWARAIADKVDDEDLKTCILRSMDWDWYSGMALYGGGKHPFTYDGFTYDIFLEI